MTSRTRSSTSRVRTLPPLARKVIIAAKPEITYRIADKDGNYCIEFHSRYEADKYFEENKHYKRFKDYSVQKHEQYPFYNQNWNELMKVVSILFKSGSPIVISPEIDETYKRVLSVFDCL